MTFARIRLVVAAAAFLAWLGWLAAAVWQKDAAAKVSRAQLAAATAVIVAEVTAGEDGLPLPKVKVVLTLTPNGPAVGTELEVFNLPQAAVPGKGFPGPGQYLLPVVGDRLVARVAGLPRSPGFEEATPPRPVVYPWSSDVQAQLRTLKYEW